MDIRKLVIDAEKSVGGNLMLVDVLPAYIYVNGKRSEEVSGFKYVVALPEHALEKLAVKIDGDLIIDKPVNDFPVVKFDDLELSIYWTSSGYQVSAKATGIRLVNDNKPSK